ncbi:cell division protein FtsQ/DivIB [Agitococcus lubricus]|uniref:Cell division protein FtsQ n=1 Tax=Agitococcus lubricus TaxID=1077255 RepID=A0A2T5J0K0_9GAMM|nr:cell division protein FtsQ/DivIB [Agitococcus lubricus]PTQ89869.1 cell division protein FtsQ [Agitococcus lubricus]
MPSHASSNQAPLVLTGTQRHLRTVWRVLSFLWLLAAFALLGWGLMGLVHELQRKAPLALVQVEGDISVADREELSARLKPVVQGSYFSTDLVAIRDAVLASPWVESMSVQRRWPDGIRVIVVEKKAVARWGSKGYLSAKGEVFQPKVSQQNTDLPLLFGPVGKTAYVMDQYRSFNERFRELKLRVVELHLTERRTWFIRFDNGIQVVLDQNFINEKLQRFTKLYQRELTPYADRIATIDLRYRNGLAVAWKEGLAVPVTHNQLQRLPAM